MWFVFLNGFLGILFLVCAVLFDTSYSPFLYALIASVVPLTFIASLFYRKNYTGNLRIGDFYTFFSISYIIVYCQNPILLLFYPEIAELPRYENCAPTFRSIYLAVAGYFLFNSGYFCGVIRQRFRCILTKVPVNSQGIYIQVALLSILATVFYLYALFTDETVSLGHFSSGTISSYALVVFSVFSIVALSLEFYRLKNTLVNPTFLSFIVSFNIPLAILILIVLGSQLYFGDRGLMITLGSVLFIGYNLYIKPVNVFVTVILGFLGVFILAFIMQFRGFSDYGRTADMRFSRTTSILSEYRWHNFTAELAGSYWVLNATTTVVPKQIEHKGGRLLMSGFLSGIPFVNRHLDNTSSARILTDFFVVRNPYGHGIGTTLIGDLYMDLSYYGLLILILLGYLIYQVESLSLSKTAFYSLYFYFSFCSSSIILPRSSLCSDIRNIFLGFVLLWLLDRLFSLKTYLRR